MCRENLENWFLRNKSQFLFHRFQFIRFYFQSLFSISPRSHISFRICNSLRIETNNALCTYTAYVFILCMYTLDSHKYKYKYIQRFRFNFLNQYSKDLYPSSANFSRSSSELFRSGNWIYKNRTSLYRDNEIKTLAGWLKYCLPKYSRNIQRFRFPLKGGLLCTTRPSSRHSRNVTRGTESSDIDTTEQKRSPAPDEKFAVREARIRTNVSMHM